MGSNTLKPPGFVYLVGAGPGNPDLITVRGATCLGRADVVLYDYLVNPAVLSWVAPHADRICLGRHRRQDIWPQSRIEQVMIDHALKGHCVVRLKGGDPMIFGRAGEELAALSRAGIPFEVVPGVTTASAAAAYSGVMLTERSQASAVALVTGQEQFGKPESSLDFQALANFPGTLVVYMGVRTVAEWSQALMAAGKPATTPCLVARRCSWPDQQTQSCQLADLAGLLRHTLKPPLLVLIGEAARVRTDFLWFTQRPLFGHRVLVTRPADQAEELVTQLQELGADVWVQPAIEIGPPPDWESVDEVLDQLDAWDWIVFSSRSGVDFFLNRLFDRGEGRGGDWRTLHGCKLAAVGESTADRLREFHLHPDVVPEEFHAEGLIEALRPHARNARILLVRANRGRNLLASQLEAAGAKVAEVVAYFQRDVERLHEATHDWIGDDGAIWVTATSSSIARASHRLLAPFANRLRWASLSPITTGALHELGIQPQIEAVRHDAIGLVSALVDVVLRTKST